MRFVIFGAGAIGGTIGGRLFEAGQDVVLVARGPHGEAIRAHGLDVASPAGSVTLAVPAVSDVGEVDWQAGDVVLLGMKSQDTAAALAGLAVAAPPDVRVVCAQNGVANERMALRSFAEVYGMNVFMPSTHLEPGRVLVHSAPVSGVLDLGRYPGGDDDAALAMADTLRSATFECEARPDIMHWKYRKLVTNLANAVLALCGPVDGLKPIVELVQAEGEAVLAAAGIDVATREEDRVRRGDILNLRPVEGVERLGGSSWQSLQRGTGSIEADYLNGEIVLLGRLHDVPTPVNEVLQRLANEAAANRRAPGHLSPDELMNKLSL